MRQILKLVRVFAVMFVHTFSLWLSVRFIPPHSREAFRARRLVLGCRAVCRALGIQVHLEGKLPSERPMLAVSNHLGVIDPFILASCMPVSFAGKAELARRPFIGWVTREMGVIFVERDRPHRTGDFVRAIKAKRNAGVLVLVFPEGTTTGSEHLLPFRTGAFATVENIPDATILPLHLWPVAVNGKPVNSKSARVLKWGDESFNQHIWSILSLRELQIRVRVGEPVQVGECNRKELARILHERVGALGHAA